MSNVSLRIYTAAFPTITANDLKYVVYKESDPLVEVASQIFAPPHADRHVSFNGLERTNYIWKLIELLHGTTTVVQQKGAFNIVPDNNEVHYKDDALVEVDLTTGWVNGATGAVMDGNGGKYDWRGWEFSIERIGQGTLKRDIDYTWDTVTGDFALLLAGGSVLQPIEYYYVRFTPLVNQTSGAGLTSVAMATKIITGNDSILAADIGKKIIIKGVVNNLAVALPDINTVTQNVITRIESGIGLHLAFILNAFAGQTFDFGKGNLASIYFGVCEWMNIYRNGAQWRVDSYGGNFLTVGRIINSDITTAGEYNVTVMDGSDKSVDDFARLYDFVQRLPPAQVVNYADWATGNNKYKYSYASGGVFKVPDRRRLYARNTQAELAGLFADDQIKEINIPIQTGGGGGTIGMDKNVNNEGNYTLFAGNTETHPKTYFINQYILT